MRLASYLLIVDDDPANHAVAGAVLADAGWRIDRADDGVAAVTAANDRQYALILMDIQMPGLDGFGAAKAIRHGTGRSAASPILAFTAAQHIDTDPAFKESGMDGHLAKPFTAETLRNEVGRWMPANASASIAGLATTFGATEIARLLAGFRAQLEAALATEPDTTRYADAHRLAGIAGTLGFPEVSRLWLAVSEGDGTAYAAARVSTRKALAEIDAISIAAEPNQAPGGRR
jgi:CheY-like chemotaxis protein